MIDLLSYLTQRTGTALHSVRNFFLQNYLINPSFKIVNRNKGEIDKTYFTETQKQPQN